jgi:hypothetical protein
LSNSFDAAVKITDKVAQAAQKAGVKAIARYLSNNPEKNITLPEFEIISKYGIEAILVWEAQGDRVSNFTSAQGKQDAQRAIKQADALGLKGTNTGIYFAVDFDCSVSQLKSNVAIYFAAVKQEFLDEGVAYRVGVYGNGLVCATLLANGTVALCWLWGVNSSYGTQTFLASNKWVIHQHVPSTEFGISVDPDDVQGDFGGAVVHGTPIPATPVAPPPQKVTQTSQNALKSIQAILGVTQDGIWGPASQAALKKLIK